MPAPICSDECQKMIDDTRKILRQARKDSLKLVERRQELVDTRAEDPDYVAPSKDKSVKPAIHALDAKIGAIDALIGIVKGSVDAIPYKLQMLEDGGATIEAIRVYHTAAAKLLETIENFLCCPLTWDTIFHGFNASVKKLLTMSRKEKAAVGAVGGAVICGGAALWFKSALVAKEAVVVSTCLGPAGFIIGCAILGAVVVGGITYACCEDSVEYKKKKTAIDIERQEFVKRMKELKEKGISSKEMQKLVDGLQTFFLDPIAAQVVTTPECVVCHEEALPCPHKLHAEGHDDTCWVLAYECKHPICYGCAKQWGKSCPVCRAARKNIV
jgi:hypothetical protein